MSNSDLERRIEAELKAIRTLVEEALGSKAVLEPMAVSLQRAAIKMNCSVRHVQRLIHTGQLLTTNLGSKRMVRVPMSEIRRFTSAMPEVGQQPSRGSRRPTASMPETPRKWQRFSASEFEAEFTASKLSKKKPKKR